MKTEVYKNHIGNSAEIINNGGLVGVPTETVYGLAGNGLDESVVKKIYEVKGRPKQKPLSLMVSDSSQIDNYCKNVPQIAYHFAEKYWPGPLTIILEAKDNIPSIVLAGGNTVGLRCPASGLTLQLLKQCNVPLAVPSANISGQPSPKTADEVLNYFDGVIDAVIDGGVCGVGKESTIIDLSFGNAKIIRKGALKSSIIGITGQTGSGKTSVLNYLSDNQCAVIDCDKVYHKLLDTSKELNDELFKEFPDSFVDGKVNRKLLAKEVFSDKSKLLTLNKITHRHISYAVLELILDYNLLGFECIAIDAVELISSGLSNICDRVVGVIADINTRAERIMKRDSISYDDALLRLKSQRDDEYFKNNCDYIIENNGTYEELINRCEEVFQNEKE